MTQDYVGVGQLARPRLVAGDAQALVERATRLELEGDGEALGIAVDERGRMRLEIAQRARLASYRVRKTYHMPHSSEERDLVVPVSYHARLGGALGPLHDDLGAVEWPAAHYRVICVLENLLDIAVL